MLRILIVGSGLTGAVTSSLLKLFLPQNCYVALWDKAKRPGGRLNTSVYSRDDDNSSVDLGAQYISPTPQEYADHNSFYAELENCGLLRPMTCSVEGNDKERPVGTKHFVAPRGMRSLVEHFVSKSGADVHFEHHLSGLSLETNGYVPSTLNAQLTPDKFDCVVLTMPVPQILLLSGSMPSLLDQKPDIKNSLLQVQFSCRYALGVFLPEGMSAGIDWTVKYFDDPIIRYVAVDADRRCIGADSVKHQSLVVHTTVPFGLEMINNDRDSICSNVVLPRLHQLLPELPKPSLIKMHKWRYSQVFKEYPGVPGAVILHNSPLLVLAGDSFTYSKFDGCLTSAVKAANIVQDYLCGVEVSS